MPLNSNTSPYYDDYDQDKQYYRIMFYPGRPVQARELTQLQTMLQKQIERFGGHVFQHGARVLDGQLAYGKCKYIKLADNELNDSNEAEIDVTNIYSDTTLMGAKLILDPDSAGDYTTDDDGSIITPDGRAPIAQVVLVAPREGSDPPTALITYESGDTFRANDYIKSVTSTEFPTSFKAVISTSNSSSGSATGNASYAGIGSGVFYIKSSVGGHFAYTPKQRIILSKYTNTPTYKVGLKINESFVDETQDSTLYDNAGGNYQTSAPGAHRLKIALDLQVAPNSDGSTIDPDSADDFVELLRLENGLKAYGTNVGGPMQVYSILGDALARRTYDESGNYVVDEFDCRIEEATNPPGGELNVIVQPAKGKASAKAYIRGREYKQATPWVQTISKARNTTIARNLATPTKVGAYLVVQNFKSQTIGNYQYLNPSRMPIYDLHSVQSSDVDTSNAFNYNSTRIGSFRFRDIKRVRANTYAVWVSDFKGAPAITGSFAGIPPTVTVNGAKQVRVQTANTSGVDDAYVGARISIMSSVNYSEYAGQTRTIIKSFANGVMTLDQPFLQPSDNALWPFSNETYSITLDPVTAGTGNGCIVNSGIEDHDQNYGLATQTLSDLSSNAEIAVTAVTANNNVFRGGFLPVLLFPLETGASRVANSIDTSVTSTDNRFIARFDDVVPASGSTVTIETNNFRNYGGTYSGADFVSNVKEDYVVLNESTGQMVNSDDFDVTSFSTSSVTITCNTGQINNLDNVRVICPVEIRGLVAKTKVLHRGVNTADVAYTITTNRSNSGNGHVVFATPNKTPGSKDNLGMVDVYRIRDIYDTLDPNVAPTGDIIQDDAYKVTSNYTLDSGQREDIYDYASVVLKSGAPGPKGQLLVVFDWFEHQDTAGAGYFSIDSYKGQLTVDQIPSFISSRTGVKYALKDYLDFRPTRQVDTATSAAANTAYSIPLRHIPNIGVGGTALLQVDGNAAFRYDLQYFAPRFDKIVLGIRQTAAGANTGMLKIVSGSDDRSPALLPKVDQEDLSLFTLSIPSYTSNSNDVIIMRENNKRFTMKDIGGIKARVDRLEYYSSLTFMEQDLANINIYDRTGQIERFKSGFLVDTFDSGTAVADTGTVGQPNLDFQASIGKGQLRPAVEQENLQLTLSVADSTNIKFSGGAAYLPYTTVTNDAYLQQVRATTNGIENINPFQVQTFHGEITLSPRGDNWKSTVDAPIKKVDTAGAKQAYETMAETLNDRMGASLTEWGEWENQWFGEEKIEVSYVAKDPAGAYDRVLQNPPPMSPDITQYFAGGGTVWNPETGYEFQEGGAGGFYRAGEGVPYSDWDIAGTDWLRVHVQQVGPNPYFNVPSQTHVIDDVVQRTIIDQDVHQLRRGTYQTYQVKEDQIEINSFVLDINTAHYMRPVDIKFRAVGLKPSTIVYPLFDNIPVRQYTERANELVLRHTSGDTPYLNPFNVSPSEEEVLISSTNGFGIAIGAEGNTVFIVSANGNFNPGDTVTGSKTTPSPGKEVVSYKHYSGTPSAATTTTITLDESATYGWYNTSSGSRAKDAGGGSPGVDLYGRKIYITEGRGYGQERTIEAYNNTTSVLTVSTAWDLTPNTQSRYSIDNLKTTNRGSSYGVLHVPNYNWANRTVEEYPEGSASGDLWQSNLRAADERTLDTQRFTTGTKIFSLRDVNNTFQSEIATHAEEPFKASGLIETRQPFVQDVYGLALETVNVQESRVITNRTEETAETGLTIDTGQVISWFDPLAQSFLVDPHKYPEGIFIESVDLWFSTKHNTDAGTDIPVTVEIRPTESGVPSAAQIIAKKTLSSEDIAVTSGALGDIPSVANTATLTNFKFDYPVYLSGGSEYSIVLRSDSVDYTVWTAKIGGAKVGTGNGTGVPEQIVDSQPHLGSMFKSQNGSTWQPEPNQDLMFRLRKCKFETGQVSTVIWKSANAQSQMLPSFVRVSDQLNHVNWTGSNPSLGGYWTNPYAHKVWTKDFVFDAFRVDTATLQYPSTSVSFDYDCVKSNETLVPNVFDLQFETNDGYKPITLNKDTKHPSDRLKIIKDASGSFVLRGKLSTSNEDITPIINLERLGLTMFKNLINNGGLYANTWPRSFVATDDYASGNVVGGGFVIESPGASYQNGDTFTATTPTGKLGSGAEGTLVVNGTGSIVGVTLTNTGNTYLANPTINISTGTGSGAVLSYVGEETPNGPGPFQARYMTKKVIMAPGFDSKDIRVFLTVTQPPGTRIHVYAKVRSQTDDQSFDEKSWQLLQRGQSIESETSQSETDYREIKFGGSGDDDDYPLAYISNPDGAPGGGERYSTFNEFAIKIVMQSNDPRVVPVVRDMRAVAIE